jgi:hypothetical protein
LEAHGLEAHGPDVPLFRSRRFRDHALSPSAVPQTPDPVLPTPLTSSHAAYAFEADCVVQKVDVDNGDLTISTDESLWSYGMTVDIDQLIARYRHGSRRLYRVGLLIRVVIVFTSFLAVLPDSALFNLRNGARPYGLLTTSAGLLAALLFVVLKNLRLDETLEMYDEFIAYLQEKKLYLLTRDGLSRTMVEIEIQKELTDREAHIHKGMFDGLDRLFHSWNRRP